MANSAITVQKVACPEYSEMSYESAVFEFDAYNIWR